MQTCIEERFSSDKSTNTTCKEGYGRGRLINVFLIDEKTNT